MDHFLLSEISNFPFDIKPRKDQMKSDGLCWIPWHVYWYNVHSTIMVQKQMFDK